MSLRWLSDQCFLARHPEQAFYHGKLFIAEVHRIRVRT